LKTALVTGSSGQIGSEFVKQLTSSGYDVTCVDIKLGKDFSVQAFLNSNHEKYDVAVHTAHSVVSEGSYTEGLAISNNAEADIAFLRWAARRRQKNVIFASSGEVYGPRKDLPNELEPLTPTAPTGRLKAYSESLGTDLMEDSGQFLFPRYFHQFSDLGLSYYGSDNPIMFISKFKRFIRKSSGEELLDFMYTPDAVRITLNAFNAGWPGTLNVCSGNVITFNEFIDLFIKVSGMDVTIRSDVKLTVPDQTGYNGRMMRYGIGTEIEDSLRKVYENFNRR
jgi:nucleoside-diphosphate-sugar epimerase